MRAFVRHVDDRSDALKSLGAEVVEGDLLNFASVRSAMEGVHAAYFCFPIVPGILTATAHFAQAALEANVAFIVNMSQMSAVREATSHAALDHWIGERVLDRSGVPVTHIRPGFFAECECSRTRHSTKPHTQVNGSGSLNCSFAALCVCRAVLLQGHAP